MTHYPLAKGCAMMGSSFGKRGYHSDNPFNVIQVNTKLTSVQKDVFRFRKEKQLTDSRVYVILSDTSNKNTSIPDSM